MILVLTYIDKNKQRRVDYGINLEDDSKVILPNDLVDSCSNLRYDTGAGEYVIINEQQLVKS